MSVELPIVTAESTLYVFPKQVLTQSDIENRELISQKRDLSLYAFGGQQVDCGMLFGSTAEKRCKVALEESRKFILKQWQTKTKGYIRLRSTTIDATRDSEIFIEPDKNGDWHIVWITGGWDVAGSQPTDEKTVYVTDICLVKLKRATKDKYGFETGMCYLSFLNKKGEEVESW